MTDNLHDDDFYFDKFRANVVGVLENRARNTTNNKRVNLSFAEIHALITGYNADAFEYDKTIWEKLTDDTKEDIVNAWRERRRF